MHEQRLFFVGCFLALGGSVALVFAVIRLAVRRDLRITSDSFQLVGREGAVAGNVPLANIARMELVGEGMLHCSLLARPYPYVSRLPAEVLS
jgi:hypothetical protein